VVGSKDDVKRGVTDGDPPGGVAAARVVAGVAGGAADDRGGGVGDVRGVDGVAGGVEREGARPEGGGDDRPRLPATGGGGANCTLGVSTIETVPGTSLKAWLAT
jgi:hypothetical protein